MGFLSKIWPPATFCTEGAQSLWLLQGVQRRPWYRKVPAFTATSVPAFCRFGSFKTQCRCGILASSVPSLIGSRRHPGSAAAQVPAALRCGGAGSRPTCVSPGMDPVLRNTEPNSPSPFVVFQVPNPGAGNQPLSQMGRSVTKYQDLSSAFCLLDLRV